MSFRSSNPALRENLFHVGVEGSDNIMSLESTVNKSYILFGILAIVAFVVWTFVPLEFTMTAAIISGLIGFLFAIILAFKPQFSGVLAPLYAIAEGVFVGGISMNYELAFPGIVMQAVVLTFAVFLVMLLLYQQKIIQVTEKFKSVMFVLIASVAFLYVINFVLRLFGLELMPFIHEGGLFGIGFSVVVVIIASLSLLMDFDFIENGSKNNLPKYMEWYAAFSLLVTLVWLYIEILRLLSKLRGGDE